MFLFFGICCIQQAKRRGEKERNIIVTKSMSYEYVLYVRKATVDVVITILVPVYNR